MQTIQLSTKMEVLIADLTKCRKLLREYAENKASSIALYEKSIAVTLIQLKNGVEFDIEGHKIVNPPTTTAEKIARGLCYQEKLEAEQAEALYKSLIVSIEAIKAQLNGYQSINRHLDSN